MEAGTAERTPEQDAPPAEAAAEDKATKDAEAAQQQADLDALDAKQKQEGVTASDQKKARELAKMLGVDAPGWAKTAAQRKASGNGDSTVAAKPAREQKPKGWRQGTFEPIFGDNQAGSILLVETEPGSEQFELLGRMDDEDFYNKARAKVKRKGYDPDACTVITLRTRNARRSKAPEPAAAGDGE